MHSIFLFLSLISFFLLPYVGFSDNNYLGNNCVRSGNYTKNSTFEANLNKLFSSLSTKTAITAGFSKNKSGSPPDQVSGLLLCSGDTNSDVCNDCFQDASAAVKQRCPYKKEALIWFEECLLHYSNEDLLSSYDNSQQYLLLNTKSATTNNFTGLLTNLLTNVSNWAAYKSSNRFCTGKINITDSSAIYGLTQCTPDMPNGTCNQCLYELTNYMLLRFNGSQGGRLLGGRCLLRYELYQFFFGSTLWTSSSNSGTTPINATKGAQNATKGRKSKMIIIASSIAAALLLVVCSIFFFCVRKSIHKDSEIENSQDRRMLEFGDEIRAVWRNEESSSEVSLFSFSQIENATSHFALENKIGQGGFGPVYKGVLPDGLEIAVKRLSSNSAQGLGEFKTEIQLIAKLQHRNLVRLVGWSIHGEEKLLVYEFMPNRSLDFFIFDKARGDLLNWQKKGIAQGLLYLHKHSRLRIIHRDLKTSNILLDADMTPKISDFGLARIFRANELQAITKRIVGSHGYIAPEYASEGLFSEKSDVFSVGIMLLEIVSGERNTGFHQHHDYPNLQGYAWEQWKEEKWLDIVDPSLTEVSVKEIERCIHVALLCAQENPTDRPTITDVLMYLSSENVILPEPNQPAYFNVRIARRGLTSSDIEGSASSINEMSITKQEGR
ncbi:hypothetical protein LUZ60_010794 [Juncus effusus]|nr:hypothetical protein LUZ60_010794 [Juncus effusus]